MKLKELNDIFLIPPEFSEIEFSGLTNHSQKLVPGDLFIANRGLKTDGFLYLREAIQRGASAGIIEKGLAAPPGFPVIYVEDTRQAQGLIAAHFYGHPSQNLRVVGVTGTNGKTTVTHLIHHILNYAGIPAGLIGTVRIDNGKERRLSNRTTPDSIELQQYLAEMVANGLNTVVMEVSSHALALARVAGIEFDAAVVTNVTHDHFDFHGNYQRYFEAKSLLFKELRRGKKDNKYAVLNAEDPGSARMASFCKVPFYYYGLTNAQTAARCLKYESHCEPDGENTVAILLHDQVFQFQTKLPGLFNIDNLIAATLVAYQEGVPLDIIRRAIADFPGVPGRYQEIHCGQPFRVMVDFAHNPGALESIVKMAREYTQGKIILVFGCEGEKDRLKRPIMGKIAVQHVDIPILTADNVYHEDLNQIFQDVCRDLTVSEKMRLIMEPDRRAAIQQALELANPGDFIIIAGKGPEEYLVKGSEKISFNDVEVVQELLGTPEPDYFSYF